MKIPLSWLKEFVVIPGKLSNADIAKAFNVLNGNSKSSSRKSACIHLAHLSLKETSLIAEIFSEKFGRIPVVAKGARRPRSSIRGMLQSFQVLLANWSGKFELKSLNGLGVS